MRRRDLATHVHRTRKQTKDGVKWYFYAYRGSGKSFWIDTKRNPTDPAFFIAMADAIKPSRPSSEYMTPQMVDDFLATPFFLLKRERTREDYRRWALRFAEAFKDDPARIFEEPEARAEVNEWRKAWAHSPKQYDYAGTVVTRILNWAWKDAGKIRQHHCAGFTKVYEADRAEVVWTPEHREAVCAIAPEWVQRILIAACETGLRPGDLVALTWRQVETTPMGRRIRVLTKKRKKTATIPVTPAMAAVLDATPRDRLLILVSARGQPLTAHRASEGLRQWRDKAGLTPEALGYDLRLQDARGTAATRLLNAGLSLKKMAQHMGWGLRTAAAVIEAYAEVSPEETDEILVKLALAKKEVS